MIQKATGNQIIFNMTYIIGSFLLYSSIIFKKTVNFNKSFIISLVIESLFFLGFSLFPEPQCGNLGPLYFTHSTDDALKFRRI